MSALDINKLNHVTEVTQVPDTNQNVQGDGSFKFTLASAITDADLQAKVDMLLSDITAQGNRIAQHMDIRDMKKYRGLIREFMNEVVFRSHKFSRENFLDRRGRHRVYGLIKLIDSNLDELAQELVAAKKELFNLRFQNATNQLDNTSRIKEVRKNIARIQTLITEKAKVAE